VEYHPWIPSLTREQVEKMLRAIGVEKIEDLFNDIPSNIKLSREQWESLDIGLKKPVSEIEAKRIISENYQETRS